MVQVLAEVDEGRDPVEMEDPPLWSDPLDDTSHVYTPPGGLVGVEVSVGELRLGPGETEGWVVSEIITSPYWCRYDLLMVEAAVPGNSSVRVSVLDATRTPVPAGDLSDAIPGFLNLSGTDISLTGLDRNDYPSIRLQANLLADGVERPSLQSWAVHLIALDEWREDFLGTGKIEAQRELRVTGGRAELDLADRPGEYEPYPTVMVFDGNDLKFFRPNGDRTGYLPQHMVDMYRSTTATFSDLDLDGDLEMVLVQKSSYTGPGNVVIWQGEGRDNWTSENATTLETNPASQCAVGDFNGDGWPDLVFTAFNNLDIGSPIFLNRGNGVFDRTPDLYLPTGFSTFVDAGDLDNDGYDDIVISDKGGSDHHVLCYLGGIDGPDLASDIEFWLNRSYVGIGIFDLNNDGHLDVLMGGPSGIFLGGPNGPDNSSDVDILPNRDYYDTSKILDVGDINNDGHYDIVLKDDRTIAIYSGSDQGWNNTSSHTITGQGIDGPINVMDIDKDGYDDILVANETTFKVYFGGTDWPTSPGFSHDISIVDMPSSVVAAVDRPRTRWLHGSLMTEAISLPPNHRWSIIKLGGTMPAGTSVTMTILDEAQRPVEGLEDLTDWEVDLTGLMGQETIHVAVHIESPSKDVTPVLEELRVTFTRIKRPPQVSDMRFSGTEVPLNGTVLLRINATDEFHPSENLQLTVEHQVVGSDGWSTNLVGDLTIEDGVWTVEISPGVDVPAGVYRFRVNVTDADGNSTGFLEPNRTLKVLPLRPGAPTLVNARAVRGTVELSWKAPAFDGGAPITGYIILRGETQADLVEVASLGVEPSHRDTGLERGRTYHYSVVAMNTVGPGEMSQVVMVELRAVGASDPTIEPGPYVAAPIALLIVLAVAYVTLESFKYWWGLTIAPLFSRLARQAVLDNKTRLAIHGLVIENPGIHYSAIVREFDLPNGVAAYHLDVLEREDFIRFVRDGQYKRFYPRKFKVPKDHRATPLELKAKILVLVASHPGISQKEIVTEMGMNRDQVGYYLREMVKDGTLMDSKKGRNMVYHQRV